MIRISILKIKLSLLEIVPNIHSIINNPPDSPQNHNHINPRQDINQRQGHFGLLIRHQLSIIDIKINHIALNEHQRADHHWSEYSVDAVDIGAGDKYIQDVEEVSGDEQG